jgi:hypothetical protein
MLRHKIKDLPGGLSRADMASVVAILLLGFPRNETYSLILTCMPKADPMVSFLGVFENNTRDSFYRVLFVLPGQLSEPPVRAGR